MTSFTVILAPVIMIIAALAAIFKRKNVFDALTTGARDGLKTVLSITPALIALVTVVAVFRASGAADALSRIAAPLFSKIGIPPEVTPLILIRPISGSGALAVGREIMKTYGSDSLIGRTAAIMLGSTETTFYTIAVYFGAAQIKKTRFAIPAALTGDLISFIIAGLTAKFMM